MSPALSIDYCGDMGLTNTEHFPKFGVWNSLRGVELPHCPNLPFSKLRRTLFFSNTSSPFLGSVSHVVELRSRKQVFWVYATRIIALVTNHVTNWNSSVVKLVRKSMRGDVRSDSVVSNCHISISTWHKASHPNPTGISFVYMAIESIFEQLRFWWHKSILHNQGGAKCLELAS
jgi:hypothetical protein